MIRVHPLVQKWLIDKNKTWIRVVKWAQNPIVLFVKLRKPQFHELRKLRKLRITIVFFAKIAITLSKSDCVICEIAETTISQIAKVAKIANRNCVFCGNCDNPFKFKLCYLWNCGNHNFTNCESCESQFVCFLRKLRFPFQIQIVLFVKLRKPEFQKLRKLRIAFCVLAKIANF